MVVSMLLALAGVDQGAIAGVYASGFRGAASHRGHGLGYDPLTGRWVPSDDKGRDPGELDDAIADREPVLLKWLQDTDVPRYLRDAGIEAGQLSNLRRLLRG